MLLAYRANFINSAVSTCGWGVFQIIWILLLTAKIKSAYGWSSHELILISASYVFAIGIFHFFFSRNFDRFSNLIDRGGLDNLLLKPADSQFLLSLWHINYANIIRMIIGLALVYYFVVTAHIHVSPINIIGYFVLIFFGVILLYSLWFLFATIMVWFPRLTNIVDFMYNLNGVARFPSEMIYEFKNFILLFLLPFTFTIATPTRALFNKVLAGDVVGLLALTLIFFFLSRRFWQFALRSYTSASS